MKHYVFLFITIIFFKSACCQNITNEDSAYINCKIYKGTIEAKMFENGNCTYTLAVSKCHNFIEIESVHWRSISVKYRLEKLSNSQAFCINKTIANEKDLTPTCFIAIDSNMVNKIKNGKGSFKYLKDNKIYREIGISDSMILALFSTIITQHNLQIEYLNYSLRSFIGWLKVKN